MGFAEFTTDYAPFDFTTGANDDDGGWRFAEDMQFNSESFAGCPLGDGLPVDEVHERPRYYHDVVMRRVLFDNAVEFARKIDVTEGAHTFAFINGDFIFGDILEALIHAHVLAPRRAMVMSLSMSQENVDSLVNVHDLCRGEFDLDLILSGYYYNMERKPGGAVDYIREKLPWASVSFAPVHAKVMAIESHKGHKLVIHGSSNMRSSRSIENIEADADADLYEYVIGFAEKVKRAYEVHGPKTGTTKTYWKEVAR